jgi:formate dehydrogenase alpha subunit
LETVTITMDGREVTGTPGMTILDMAQESGVPIPTLCHHPYLAPSGACRLCLVEEENSGALLVSCVTPIQPGMMVNTNSPRVLERRKAIIELLLASHPDTCMVCDKGNRCDLHRIASMMGVGALSFEKIPQYGAIRDVNPFIVRDMSKCILCGRCIRADLELVVEGAIDYIDRGFVSRPATLGDVPLEDSECSFCGTCVAFCPTGALTERDLLGTGTTGKAVSTTCPFCGCGCSVSLEVKNGIIVRARPGDDSPVNKGTLCVRGSYGYDFVESPERLTTPLIRGEEGLEPATWDEALELIAARLTLLKMEEGPGSLAVLGAATCTNEENYLLQRLARGVLGTPNIDNGARLFGAATYTGLGGTVGYPSTIGTIQDIESAEVILVVGADLAATAPAVGYAVKRAVTQRGAKLILVESRKTPLSRFAHLWLRPNPGTLLALANGLARVIADEDLLDQEFVARRTDGFDDLNQSLETYTPEHVEQVTGIPFDEVRQAARLFAGAGGAAIIYGHGVTRSGRGTDTVKTLANLALLTGNIERKGSGIFALQAGSNAQGACDMGALPDFLPGYCSVTDGEGRTRFEERWGTRLPLGAGITAPEMMAGATLGSIKGMVIVGENPVSSFPDPGTVAGALGSLEFLLVQDIFLTETAKLATVVLPAASVAEKNGTFTNFEGRVQAVRQALEPAGESRPDWRITMDVAAAMGSPFPYGSLQDVAEEIEEFVSFYADVGREPEGARGRVSDRDGAPWKLRRLYQRGFPSGFVRFSPVDYTPADEPAEGYPFTLLTGNVLYHVGAGTRTSRSSRLHTFLPSPRLEVNPADAQALDIGDGDEVRVVSAAGAMDAVAAVSDRLQTGMLFAPLSFPDSPVNGLFGVALDPQSKTPALEHCAVRLERRHLND